MGAEEGMVSDLPVGGLDGWGRWWTTIDPDQPGIGRSATTQCLETKVILFLLFKPATKPDAPFPTLEYGGSTMFCQACSPPFSGVVGREKTKTVRSSVGMRSSFHQLNRRRRTCRACQWDEGAIGPGLPPM